MLPHSTNDLELNKQTVISIINKEKGKWNSNLVKTNNTLKTKIEDTIQMQSETIKENQTAIGYSMLKIDGSILTTNWQETQL